MTEGSNRGGLVETIGGRRLRKGEKFVIERESNNKSGFLSKIYINECWDADGKSESKPASKNSNKTTLW